MKEASLRIFDYAKKHPQEILAVTDAGEEILYGELNDLAAELGRIVGHRLVFVLCRNTPGSFLGYLGLLDAGGVPLLLDADIAPALLEELVRTYRPAFFLLPEDLDDKSLQVCFLNEAMQGNLCAEEQGNIHEAVQGNLCAEAQEKPGAKAGAKSGAKAGGSLQADGADEKVVLKIRDYRLLYCAPQGEERKDPVLAPQLRLLLTTSGSTGSKKLVRISAENLDANTESIIKYLQITKEDRPITVLPMQYSYGMSIINTHVMAGGAILLTKHTLMEKRFWERVRDEKCTSLCGVPYTFEMYSRLGLMKMDLPALKAITQAGGKLSEKRHMQFAQWAAEKGIRFYVMYGQTEASPRMGWLPPEKAIEKCGSMGIAIPGGKIELIDENGEVITECRPSAESASGIGLDLSPVGELVYKGPNVALGYAVCAEDLAKGEEFHGILHTGDMARCDGDGYFYIVGRQSRFIKIGGKRIGLDEVEKILRAAFPETDIACAGKDEELRVYAAVPGEGGSEKRTETNKESDGRPVRKTGKESCIEAVKESGKGDGKEADKGSGKGDGKEADKGSGKGDGKEADKGSGKGDGKEADKGSDGREAAEEICACIREMTGIPDRRISVFLIPEIPRNSSGKIQYSILNQ